MIYSLKEKGHSVSINFLEISAPLLTFGHNGIRLCIYIYIYLDYHFYNQYWLKIDVSINALNKTTIIVTSRFELEKMFANT